MRYRVTFDQVMDTWYVTVRLDEPDGAAFSKTVGHYHIQADEISPLDLGKMLHALAAELA